MARTTESMEPDMPAAKPSPPPAAPPVLPRRDRGTGVTIAKPTLTFLRNMAVARADLEGGRASASKLIHELVESNREMLTRKYSA